MKKLNLIFGILLLGGMSLTTLNAKCGGSDGSKTMKCGAGKCGTAAKPMPKGMKCGAGKCGGEKNVTKEAKKVAPKSMKCGANMKCAAGKCGNK